VQIYFSTEGQKGTKDPKISSSLTLFASVKSGFTEPATQKIFTEGNEGNEERDLDCRAPGHYSVPKVLRIYFQQKAEKVQKIRRVLLRSLRLLLLKMPTEGNEGNEEWDLDGTKKQAIPSCQRVLQIFEERNKAKKLRRFLLR